MAKAIMIQGTMSSAGKSLVAAGLCRVFKQDGYKVAPFKSQNMALNSFITEEGLEMGRAQVMQAEACGIKPTVVMNPILLKPTTDVGSQVIVNGEVRGNMKAADYFKYKKSLIPDIMKAYHKLEEEYDIIVIEGAGSPAEINLKSEDIVNMGMAKLANAPVLLVGDIDRGGVFAQLAGTLMLLEEEEKKRIKAMIINKFRGDKSILEPGLVMLRDICGKEVAGVIPYVYLDLDEEDSLSERFDRKTDIGIIDIAIIKFPRISNFTDFNALEQMEGVTLRYITNTLELRDPDMIILPGTKSTMQDLLWMRQNGLEAAVKQNASRGKLIMGICGGYQMLGETLSDPYQVEASGIMDGMGLLPMNTIFEEEKVRTRVSGFINTLEGELSLLSKSRIEGYEIHMGVSTASDKVKDKSLSRITDWLAASEEKVNEEVKTVDIVKASSKCDYNSSDNTENRYNTDNRNTENRITENRFNADKSTKTVKDYAIDKGSNTDIDRTDNSHKTDGQYSNNIFGTYVHGIFDSEEFLEGVVKTLYKRKGLPYNQVKAVDLKTYKEQQYDLLADTIRNNLDMEFIYRILKEDL